MKITLEEFKRFINGQIFIQHTEGSCRCFEIQSITPDGDGNLTFATTGWTAYMPTRSMRITSGGTQHYKMYAEQVNHLPYKDEDSLMFISTVTGCVIVLYKQGHPNNYIPPTT